MTYLVQILSGNTQFQVSLFKFIFLFFLIGVHEIYLWKQNTVYNIIMQYPVALHRSGFLVFFFHLHAALFAAHASLNR